MAEGQGNHAMPEMEDLLRPVSETIKHSMAEGQRNHAMPEMEYLLRAVSEPIDEIRRRLEENNVPYDKETLKSIFTGLDEKTQNKVKSCLEGIGKSIVKLSSNDPAKQMSGALDLVASVTVFIPTVGPIISGVCLLVSNVIIAFGAKPSGTNIAAELEHVLEKVIGKYHDDDVKAAAAGVSFKLRNMLTYLDGYTMTDPNAFPEEELVKLASHDLEYTNVGVECLGTLESYIKQYSVNKPSEDHDAVEHQARCALDYIDAYLELSVVRKLLLSLYYCILLSTGRFEATTNGVMRSIQLATEKEIEIVGIVPMDYTTPDKAVLASVFNLAEHPVFTAYNRTRTAVAMDGRTVQIKSKKWPKIHLYLNANFDLEPNGVQRGVNYIYSVTVSKKHTIQSCFTFKKVRDDDIFTCESIFHRKKIGSTEESNFGIAHNTDELKLIRLFEMNGDMDQQLYLIALVKSPAKFVFCTDNKSWFRDEYPSLKEGDPGEQGYWYLDQAGAENARPRSECSVSYIT